MTSISEYNLVGSGVSDLFQGIGANYKAKGNRLEAENYREASKFADLEAKLQGATTDVETAQVKRQAYQGLGRTSADIAGAGFGTSGSAGDLLRSSAQQGALQAAMAHQTGQVAEIGFQEQSKSYANMADAADLAAQAQETSGIGSFITGGLKLAASVAML